MNWSIFPTTHRSWTEGKGRGRDEGESGSQVVGRRDGKRGERDGLTGLLERQGDRDGLMRSPPFCCPPTPPPFTPSLQRHGPDCSPPFFSVFPVPLWPSPRSLCRHQQVQPEPSTITGKKKRSQASEGRFLKVRQSNFPSFLGEQLARRGGGSSLVRARLWYPSLVPKADRAW